MKQEVKPAEGKLGIMVVGCGAVATTFMTGVLMVRKGLSKPVGSMTQYDKIRVGRGAEKKYLHYGDIVPLAKLDDIVFGTWDAYPQNAYQAAVYAEVLKAKDIEPVRDELEKIVPMKAAFDANYAKRITGDNVKQGLTRWEMVEALRQDIRDFKQQNDCARVVVIWAASTEIYVPYDEAHHATLASLEQAMKADDRDHVAPSMCYAYAALAEGAPFIMGAPNTTVDIPAMWEMAEKTKMPIAGKDFKTGQTLVKSGFAPILKVRNLGLAGWFSTNILGNRDGLVLDEPANFHTKEVSKLLHARDHLPCRGPARPLWQHLPQGAHQLLPAAQRQQGGMGQHRHLRMDGLSDADQDQLPLPRLHPRRPLAARPDAPERPRRPCRPLRHPALPELLPQGAHARLHQGRAGRQQPLRPVCHAEERHPRNGWL